MNTRETTAADNYRSLNYRRGCDQSTINFGQSSFLIPSSGKEEINITLMLVVVVMDTQYSFKYGSVSHCNELY